MTDIAPVLDFNSRPKIPDLVNGLIDAGLEAGDRLVPPRTYLGGSRLGHPCERALQFEYAQAPKDEGAGFDGRTLRIFAIGHALEDLAAAWLRAAGFDLYTRKTPRRRATDPTAASSASPSPADASAATSTASSPMDPRCRGWATRRCGNARR